MVVLFGSLSVPMAAAFGPFPRVRAGASVICCRFPTAHARCSKPSRRSSTTTVRRDLNPLSPSPDSLSAAAVGKSAGHHYIREDYIVEKVTSSQLQELLKGERSVPLVIGFYATWCGPCVLMAQDLEMLAVEYESNALFVKVDTDDEYEFARDMQVRGLPTLYFISPDPSKDAIRTEGLVPPEMIKNIIDNAM